MTTPTDAEWMAEAIERARFENLRQGVWEDLRPAERTTRVQILREAMIRSGVAGEIDSLRAKSDRTGLLLDLIEQRDQETLDQRARHEAELNRLVGQVSAYRARTAELAEALAEAESRARPAPKALTPR